MGHRAKFRADRSNRCGDMAIFRFFKAYGWNRCSNFDNMPVFMFCEFGLKMPIHSSF